jgi:hypothetical protein
MAAPGGAPAQAHRLRQQATADRVQTVVATTLARPPLLHLLDEPGRPDPGMSPQRPGRQQRVERIEDSLILAAVRHVLDDRAREALPVELAAQQGGQKAAQPVGLERDRGQVVLRGEARDLPAELCRLVDVADQARIMGEVATPCSQ